MNLEETSLALALAKMTMRISSIKQTNKKKPKYVFGSQHERTLMLLLLLSVRCVIQQVSLGSSPCKAVPPVRVEVPPARGLG